MKKTLLFLILLQASVVFSQSCDPVADINENFDTAITPALPSCWVGTIQGASFASVNTINWDSFSAPNSVDMYNSDSPASADIMLVSPILSNLDAGTHWLRFYAKNNATSEDLEVGTMSDPTDPSTFTVFQSIDINMVWAEYAVDFTTYTGTDEYLAIRRLSTSMYTSVYLDNMVWEEMPFCLPPSNVEITNLTSEGFSISWDAFANASGGYEYMVIFEGLDPETATPLAAGTTTDTFADVVGLDPATNYSVHVRSNCGDAEGWSAWSNGENVLTNCVAVTDFNEDFDAVTTPELPTCWSEIIEGADFASVNTMNWDSFSAPNGVEMFNSDAPASADIMLVSPILSNVDAGTHWLRFYAKNSTNSEDLEIGTLSDPTDPSTFTVLQSVDINFNWMEYSVDFTSYTGTDQYLAIRRMSTTTYTSVYLDNIVWEEMPFCLPPSNIEISSLTSEGFSISWDAFGNASNGYEYMVVFQGLDPETATPLAAGTTTDTFADVSGLDPATDYSVYVRSNCGDAEGWSEWSSAENVLTNCVAVTDFSEGFDTVTMPDLPTCWNQVLDNGASQWASVSTTEWNNFSAPNGVEMWNSDSPVASNIILVAPWVSNLNSGTHWLRFQGRNSESTQDVEVGTMTDPTDGSTFTAIDIVDLETEWQEFYIDFSGYSGTDEYIAIRRFNSEMYTSVLLDDIVWEERPSCVLPTDLVVNSTSTSGAVIAWDEMGVAPSNGYSWAVVVEGGDPDVAADIVSTGTSSIPEADVTGLQPATTYDFYVMADCGTEGISTWSSAESFLTLCVAVTEFSEDFDAVVNPDLPVCWDKIMDNGVDEWATLNTVTWESQTAPNAVDFYNSSSAPDANIILVAPAVSNLDAGTHWLRFYAKNSFAETQDLEVGTLSDPNDGSTFSVFETVDINEEWDEYMVDFTSYTGTDQYIAIRRISTEMYTNVYMDNIVWELRPSCIAPDDLAVVETFADGVTIDWVGPVNAMGDYQYVVVLQGGDPENADQIIQSGVSALEEVTIEGLESNTDYQVYLIADCGSVDGVSNFSHPISFTTMCEPPTGLQVTQIGLEEMEFSWDPVPGTLGYEFIIVPSGMPLTEENYVAIGTIGSPEQSSLLVENLEMGGEYDLYLRIVCETGFYGEWHSVDFATLGVDSNHIEGLEYYPNPVQNVLFLKAATPIESVSVYNLLGQEVRSINPQNPQYEIDLSLLNTGMYLLRVTAGGKTAQYKIAKK